MIEDLPTEIQEYIFCFLSTKERMQVAKTNKNLNQKTNAENLWKLDSQRNNISVKEADNYKKRVIQHFLFLNKKGVFTDEQTPYYIVGNSIGAAKYYEEGGYKGPRTITSSEIANSFPSSMNITVLPTLEDAKKACEAKEKHALNGNFLQRTCAIFTVNLKTDIKAFLWCESYRTHGFNCLYFYDYFKTDIRNITNVSCEVRVGPYQEQRIDEKISIIQLPTGGTVRVIEEPKNKKSDMDRSFNNCRIV